MTTEDLKKELQDKTNVGAEIEKRVFYTLMNVQTRPFTESLKPMALHNACHRLATFCGLLIEMLEEKEILSHEEIDTLLMDTVSPQSSEVFKGCIASEGYQRCGGAFRKNDYRPVSKERIA